MSENALESSFAGDDIRVGVDLASIPEVQHSISTYGQRYVERIFTQHERESAQGGERKTAESLAARFAAKEATLKVLRPGDQAIPWQSIEVRTDESGACELLLSGEAATMASAAGLEYFALSMSHEGDMAVAVVIARGRSPKSD